MNQADQRFDRGREHVRGNTKDGVRFVRPDDTQGDRVKTPTPDVGNGLRLRQEMFFFSEVLLRPIAFRQGREEPANDLSDRDGAYECGLHEYAPGAKHCGP